MSKMQIKKSWCTWCKGKCGVKVFSENNIFHKIEIDSEALTGAFGAGCKGVRLKYGVDWFNSQHRLRNPLKRKGNRGENKWEQVTWEQALDEIAGRLSVMRSKYGPETLVVSAGDSSWTHDEYKTRFLNLFGSPNIIGASPICLGPRSLVCEAVFGWYPQMSVGPTTKCVVALGVNIHVSRPGVWRNFLKLKTKAKLITIDPRQTETTEKGDLWIQLKPGTDAAVLLAMINHIITWELYDKEFVAKWCYGFEQLWERVAPYTPEKVAEISEVPADILRQAAEIYATNKPGVFIEGMGVEQQANSAQIIHARCILAGLTGNVDIEGGEQLLGPHSKTGFVTDRQIELLDKLPQEQRKKQIGYDKFKLHSWPGQELLEKYIGGKVGEKGSTHWYTGQANTPSVFRTILSEEPYPIKAMISSASSPLLSHANTRLVYEGIKKLDLFVMFDLVMNPTAQLADYVLPAASWLERPQLWSYLGFQDALAACQAALPPKTGEYDRKNDFDFWRGLGIRLGQEEFWPWETLEESYNDRLKAVGLSFDKLCHLGWYRDIKKEYKKYERNGFSTPTGKIELYSTIFEELGYDPLPFYEAPPISLETKPQLEGEYPLILINGARVREFMLSLWREVPAVRGLHPDPIVQINPETAKQMGIDNGDWVWIETPMGRIRQRCHYFTGIKPGIAHADGQWWYPELPGEEPFLYGIWISNINKILDDDPAICNEIVGSWPLRHAICKIYK